MPLTCMQNRSLFEFISILACCTNVFVAIDTCVTDSYKNIIRSHKYNVSIRKFLRQFVSTKEPFFDSSIFVSFLSLLRFSRTESEAKRRKRLVIITLLRKMISRGILIRDRIKLPWCPSTRAASQHPEPLINTLEKQCRNNIRGLRPIKVILARTEFSTLIVTIEQWHVHGSRGFVYNILIKIYANHKSYCAPYLPDTHKLIRLDSFP